MQQLQFKRKKTRLLTMIFSMFKIFMHNIRRVLGEKKKLFHPQCNFLKSWFDSKDYPLAF